MRFSIKNIILYLILIYVNVISATIMIEKMIVSSFNNLTEEILMPAVDLYEMQQKLKLQHDRQQEKFRKRSKRFIIFNGNGIIKLVLAYSQPLDFGLKKPFQQLNTIYNFQLQFQVPTKPIYPWNTKTWAMRIITDRSLSYDISRIFIYQIIESFLINLGFNGKECLLKTLCNVAYEPIHGVSLFHDILRIILSPSVNNIDSIYWNARESGLKSADCSKLYPKCEESENWLKKLSQYY